MQVFLFIFQEPVFKGNMVFPIARCCFFFHTLLMTILSKPTEKPFSPYFGSGPCKKRPLWDWTALERAALCRSHRSKIGLEKIQTVIGKIREILCVPEEYKIGIMPAGAMGATESIMWCLLGQRPLDALIWDVFGGNWLKDIEEQLKLKNVNVLRESNQNFDLFHEVDFRNDVLLVWNGSTTGICPGDGEWIPDNRRGLVLCDATSAAFAMPLPWEKLDATTFSWQKALGSEGAHGVVILSPRAIQRLETYEPAWPIPRVLRMAKGGVVNEGIFEGYTLNTPSMMCVEDMLDALNWAENIGGLSELCYRTEQNYHVIEQWLEENGSFKFLVERLLIRSHATVCIVPNDENFQSLSWNEQHEVTKKIAMILEQEGVAFDIKGHFRSKACIRIWCGPTVEAQDIKKLLPWVEWAYGQTSKG